MKKVVSILVLACLVGAGGWFLFLSKSPAPSVTFHTLEDKSIALEDMRGKVVLVKFWATSCVTCIRQMPDTISLYEELGPKGFEVVAVAMSYDPVEYVRQFASTRKLPFTVALDSSGEVARAFDDVRLTPDAYLISKDGSIIKRYLGNYDKEALRDTVQSALAS